MTTGFYKITILISKSKVDEALKNLEIPVTKHNQQAFLSLCEGSAFMAGGDVTNNQEIAKGNMEDFDMTGEE